MTEIQAKSGAAEASAKPDEEAVESSSPTTGSAVGRATVPATTASPKFTRAPGMPPPPDKPVGDDGDDKANAAGVPSPVVPVVTGTAFGGTSVTGGASPGASGSAATAGTPPSGDGSAGQPASSGSDGSGDGATTTTSRPGFGRIQGVAAARVAEAVRAARGTVSSAAARGPRRARLKVKRIDPWSVMKFSFAVSFVLFVVVIVATSVLYLALDAMGVFDSVNGTLTDLISAGGGQGGDGFRITAFGVIGGSALLGLINMVLFTALATLGAFIYNVCADLVGGVEITLAERD
jgi:hypothetical protein